MNIKGIFKANRRFRIIPVFFLLFVLTSGIRLFPEETIPPVVQDGSSKKGDYEIISGNLKLVLYKETGTFTLYKLANTGKNKYEPILDTRNYGAGTKYSVRFGKKFYSLEKKFFRTIGFEVHDGGKAAAFVFTPSDNFQVRQKFYFSGSGNGEDSFLIIENSVENTSGNEEFFSFRALFDTVLGETGSISRPEHFITDIHGEYEAFSHVLKNGSGSVKKKIDDVFGHTLSEKDQRALATLIYYPKEKMDLVKKQETNMEEIEQYLIEKGKVAGVEGIYKDWIVPQALIHRKDIFKMLRSRL